MKYPRPYDVVVYFTSQNCKLCNDLYPEYEYLAFLYYNNGIIDQNKNPVFFMQVTYSSDTADIFQMVLLLLTSDGFQHGTESSGFQAQNGSRVRGLEEGIPPGLQVEHLLL